MNDITLSTGPSIKDLGITEATRLIKGFNKFNYPERLHELKLPTLFYRRRRCDLIQVFKIIKEFDHINSDSFFKHNHGITRKNHVYKLNKPRCKSSQKMHSFSHRIINDWNGLPNSVGDINNINELKLPTLFYRHRRCDVTGI